MDDDDGEKEVPLSTKKWLVSGTGAGTWPALAQNWHRTGNLIDLGLGTCALKGVVPFLAPAPVQQTPNSR